VRIALLGDVHGNTVALDAVLVDVRARGVDAVVCLGDLAAGGPDPAGAVERVADLGPAAVCGNTDVDLIAIPAWWNDPDASGVSGGARRVGEICRWGADELTAEHRHYLGGLPPTTEVDLGQVGRMLAFHGSPTRVRDILTSSTPDEQVTRMLGGADHEVLVGGHTHVPMLRRHRTQTIVNPGSVGAPFAAYGSSGEVAVHGHTAYAVLQVTRREWSVEFVQLPVDADRLRRQVMAARMPHGDWWLSQRGLGPP